MRVDHISIKGMLLGVWQISYSGECDPGSGEIDGALSPRSGRLDRSEIRNMKRMSYAGRLHGEWEIQDRALMNSDVRAWLKLPPTPPNI